jgi:hypothetical protein
MIPELIEQVEKFNKYDDSTMKVVDTGWDVELYIDGKLITESCDTEVLKRVKGINFENGYSYL